MEKLLTFICSHCSTTNKIAEDRLRVAHCQACNASLFYEPESSEQSKPFQRKERLDYFPILMMFVVIAIGGYLYNSMTQPRLQHEDNQRISSNALPLDPAPIKTPLGTPFPKPRPVKLIPQKKHHPTKSIPQKAPSEPSLPQKVVVKGDCKPVAQKPGIVKNKTGWRLRAPFEIETNPGSNYYIKLKRVNSGKKWIGVYATGGKSIKVKVPLGKFYLYYIQGQQWYGDKCLFGPDALAFKTDNVFSFTKRTTKREIRYSGHIVTLKNRLGGNLNTNPINISDF